MIVESDIKANVERMKERVAAAARRAGRDPSMVKILGATKTVEPERIRWALEAGISLFGENYIQEARKKIEAVGPGPKWHFIGHLQRNKAKYAVKLFDMIETVDNAELAEELNRKAEKVGRKVDVLIQVNVSGEETKSGVNPEGLFKLVEKLASLPNLRLKGLMTMPPYFEDPEEARPFFITLAQLREEVKRKGIENIEMEELSMGMSNDFEVAVEEGATIVRLGTAIFGPRPEL